MQELPAASGQRRAGNGQAAKAPDYAGAYSSNGQRSPAHEQWCSLVGIFGVSSCPLASAQAGLLPSYTPMKVHLLDMVTAESALIADEL